MNPHTNKTIAIALNAALYLEKDASLDAMQREAIAKIIDGLSAAQSTLTLIPPHRQPTFYPIDPESEFAKKVADAIDRSIRKSFKESIQEAVLVQGWKAIWKRHDD